MATAGGTPLRGAQATAGRGGVRPRRHRGRSGRVRRSGRGRRGRGAGGAGREGERRRGLSQPGLRSDEGGSRVSGRHSAYRLRRFAARACRAGRERGPGRRRERPGRPRGRARGRRGKAHPWRAGRATESRGERPRFGGFGRASGHRVRAGAARGWSRDRPAKRVLVVGGGPGGVEAARVLALQGSHVTLVEKLADLLPDEEEDVGRLVRAGLESLGVSVLTGTDVRDLTGTGAFDLAVVAAGRRPRTHGLGLEALLQAHGLPEDGLPRSHRAGRPLRLGRPGGVVSG
ncbi:MAG TPA: hypothetical protein DGR79_02220 [Clostridiales bacterium]|nr:hypothetical protein [Clostridiales bacterium]